MTNTGNLTVRDLAIVEAEFSGTGALSDPACPEAAVSLAPGEQVICTADYTVTLADVRAGELSNSAFARGTLPPAFADLVPEGRYDSDESSADLSVGTVDPSDPVDPDEPGDPATEPHDQGVLSRTGSNALGIAVGGLVLLFAGGAALLLSRRRNGKDRADGE